MTLAQSATGLSGPYLGRVASVNGGLNLRTGTYSMAFRVKWGTTATNVDMPMPTMTIQSDGRGFYWQRRNGDASTVVICYRYNGIATFNTANATGGYGSTTNWVHLGATYDGSTIRTYVDGVASGTVSSASTLIASGTMDAITIGPFTGDVADVVMFARALSASEMQQLAKRRMPFMSQGNGDLIGWWPMHNPNSLNEIGEDYGYQGNDLTLQSSGANNPTAAHTSVPYSWGSRRANIWLPASFKQAAGDMSNSSALAGATQALATSAPASSSALVGAAIQSQVAAGGLADSSALVGQAQALVVSAPASSSALSGAAIQTQAAAGGLADSSALGSAASQALVVSAAATGSALAGAAIQAQVAAGGLATSSALAGSTQALVATPGLSNTSALSGAAIQTNAAAGDMLSTSSLAGTAVQQQAAGGALATGSALSGDATTNLQAAGGLADSSALTGAATQQQVAAGSLATGSALSGQAQVLVSGALATASALSADALTLVSAAGSMATGSALAGVAIQVLFAEGHLSNSSRLLGEAEGGTFVVPAVAVGWFPDLPLTGSDHGPWQTEAATTASPHGAWTNEIPIAAPSQHTEWKAT